MGSIPSGCRMVKSVLNNILLHVYCITQWYIIHLSLQPSYVFSFAVPLNKEVESAALYLEFEFSHMTSFGQ